MTDGVAYQPRAPRMELTQTSDRLTVPNFNVLHMFACSGHVFLCFFWGSAQRQQLDLILLVF